MIQTTYPLRNPQKTLIFKHSVRNTKSRAIKPQREKKNLKNFLRLKSKSILHCKLRGKDPLLSMNSWIHFSLQVVHSLRSRLTIKMRRLFKRTPIDLNLNLMKLRVQTSHLLKTKVGYHKKTKV